MAEIVKVPTVFISYSWTTLEHEDWVILLAERLSSEGICVKLDKWDLKEGHDKYTFMESMVNSKDIDKVLIILDKKYSEKADDKSGGVGTETQIISPKIYSNVSQEKFIPLVTERDENGNAYVPAFLESRIYIDFSYAEHFESSYEKLIRNLYGRPAHARPKIGKAPSYLFEDKLSLFNTNLKVKSFDSQIDKNPDCINRIIESFFESFLDNLKEFTLTFTSKNEFEIGKIVIDNLNQYSPLRNDYILFLDKISKTYTHFDIELLIKFLEKLPIYTKPLADTGSWRNEWYSNYRFIVHELFLYTIAIPLKNENYKLVEELLHTSYFIKDYYGNNTEPSKYQKFYNNIKIFDTYYKETYSKQFISPMAEFIVNRVPEKYSKQQIITADLLCHYIARLNNFEWFPITYPYNDSESIELFDRMVSKKHFDKVKILFGVTTISEFKQLLMNSELRDKNFVHRYPNSFESIKLLHSLINIDRVGKER